MPDSIFNPKRFWPTNKNEQFALLGVIAWLIFGAATAFFTWNSSLTVFAISMICWLFSIILFAPIAIKDLFGPVFFYELIRVGRRRLTFFLRTFYLITLTIILAFVLFAWLESIGVSLLDWSGKGIRPGQMAKYGEIAFYFFAPLQYIVVVLLTPLYVGGVISDERERRTLDYILTTDLKNREIIFGKIAARLVVLLTYIIAGLPVLSLLMLFGGIDPEFLFGTYIGTIISMVVFASVSIWFSCYYKKPRDSIAASIAFVIIFLAVSGGLSIYFTVIPMQVRTPVTLLGYEIPFAEIGSWIGAINPLYLYVASFAPIGGASSSVIATKFIVVSGLIIFYTLGVSILNLRKLVNPTVGTGKSSNKSADTENRSENADSKTVKSVHRSPGKFPIFWKEVKIEGGRKKTFKSYLIGLIIFVSIFFAPVLIIYFETVDYNGRFNIDKLYSKDAQDSGCVWLKCVCIFGSFLIFVRSAIHGSGAISGEKDRDSWITLSSTPLTAKEIIIGKWFGAIYHSRHLFYFILAALIFGIIFGYTIPFMILPSLFYLLVYTMFFAALGVYFSCNAKKTLISTVKSVSATIFLAGGFWIMLMFCCLLPLSIAARGGRIGEEVILELFSSITPPFMVSWFIMPDHGNWTAPFDSNRTYQPSIFGFLAPMFGFFPWVLLTIFLISFSIKSVNSQLNRNIQQTDRKIRQKKDEKNG